MYLASKSPQRKALLESIGIDFEVVIPDYLEEDHTDDPVQLVEQHSLGKALSALPKLKTLPAGRPVLGVDTMIFFEGQAMGKAGSEEEAVLFLQRLSGRSHQVYSGITLLFSLEQELFGSDTGAGAVEQELLERFTSHSMTEVRFSKIDKSEIEAYVASGEWKQRAGAYAIQERASAFVEEIKGDYTNVVGLPVPLLVQVLRQKGLWPPGRWSG